MHLDLGFDNEENRFHFYLPEHPITKETLTITEHEEVWSTLDKLSEGTVAEFAFSTASFMTPEELLALLAPYDLDVLWLPLYMGEFVAFQPNGIGSNGNSDISLSYNYGLVGSRETDEDLFKWK